MDLRELFFQCFDEGCFKTPLKSEDEMLYYVVPVTSKDDFAEIVNDILEECDLDDYEQVEECLTDLLFDAYYSVEVDLKDVLFNDFKRYLELNDVEYDEEDIYDTIQDYFYLDLTLPKEACYRLIKDLD